jgi:hypothetical protein
VAFGVVLALARLRGIGPHGGLAHGPLAGLVHGLLGVTGFCLLLIALQEPRRGDSMGAGSFGVVAAVLFGGALVFGPLIRLFSRRAPEVAGVLLAAHGSLAVTAFVLFLAWSSLH